MPVYVVGLVLFLALASYSDASYCVCNTGLSDTVLQKNIDYACGNGADCAQINQNGACFNPNTLHDHCNYAVNSYYQKKVNLPLSCDFQGTATIVPNPPTTASSSCVYPSGPSNAGGTTPPSTGTPAGGTPPGTGTPAGGTPPGTGTPAGGTTPGTGTPAGGTPLTPTTPNIGGTPTTPGTFPGSSTTPGTPAFGMGPTGSGFDGTNASPKLLSQTGTLSTLFAVTFSSLVYAMI